MSAARPSWRAPAVALAGLVGACAICCAGPLLAVLGGIGIASMVGAFWLPALLVVAALATLGILIEVRRRRHASACPSRTGPIDLAAPTLRSRDH